MKYTINGFNQEKLLELDIDIKLIFLLKYIQVCCSLDKMYKKEFDNRIYTWIKYDGFLKEYPILKISSTKQLGVYISKLKEKGLINLIIDKTPQGTFSYICITDKFMTLTTSDITNYIPHLDDQGGLPISGGGVAENEKRAAEKTAPLSGENRTPKRRKTEPYNPITNNPITNNPITNNQAQNNIVDISPKPEKFQEEIQIICDLFKRYTGVVTNIKSHGFIDVKSDIIKVLELYTIDEIKVTIRYVCCDNWYCENKKNKLSTIFRPTRFAQKLEQATLLTAQIRSELRDKGSDLFKDIP